MEHQLYIPKKIKVGYQSRSDTYTKKLAYIIYYDDKGVLRKEKSWEGWRDKKIDAEEFDNVPTSGLVLHKDIKRYNWSHFSSGRTMIRVYDPRGIEFEITTENLIGVLMNSDCSKRGLSGEYVYAWTGKELVLLPTNAEEYEKAKNFTSLQACKIGAKDLVAGCSYKTKKEGDLIYVGRYMWYEMTNWYYKDRETTRKGKKFYIFTSDGKDFQLKTTLDFLATKNSDEVVSNYAEIIENFKKNPHSSKIVKWETIPTKFNNTPVMREYYGPQLKKSVYFTVNGNQISEQHVSVTFERKRDAAYTSKDWSDYTLKGYVIKKEYDFDIQTESQLKPTSEPQRYNFYGYNNQRDEVTEEKINEYKLHDVFITLENGNRIQLNTLYKL